jgi:macrolide transport system ATP-binding/permease protein
VRMALGARRSSVHRLVLNEAGRLAAVGVVAGLVCAMAGTTLLRKLLYGTQAWDASTLIAVAVVMTISALLASYIPARRAANIDPIQAMRNE